jgi:transglutaminase-like putative cysteine protease
MTTTTHLALLAALAATLAPAGPGTTPAPAAPGRARPPAPAARGQAVDVLSVPRPRGPEWFGIYLLGRKTGWARMEVGRESRSGQPVLVARQETVVQVTLGDRVVRRAQKDEKVYQARPGGRLLEYRSERSGDGGDRTLALTCDGQGCRAAIRAEGGEEVRQVPPPGDTAEQADPFRLAAARRGVVEGRQIESEHLRVKVMKDAFLRRERIAGAGVEIPVSVVSEAEQGDRVVSEVAVADDGRVVQIRFGNSLVARAEPEAVAKRLDRVDLFSLSRVPLEGALPRTVPQRIVFVLKGVPGGFSEADARQTFAPGPGGETVVTVTARRPAAADPSRDPPRGKGGDPELLEATPEIDADNPELRRLAAEVVGGERGAYASSARLVAWVHDRLGKVYGQSRDKASEVLAAGKGDCTEHALLFVALARAAGIPARGVHGLVYAAYGDGVHALYWHAWAEVRAGEEWIAVDPTFGQPVADATHIALGRGMRVDAVGLLGGLAVASAEPMGAP